MNAADYHPEPIETGAVELPPHLAELTERLAENAHDHWAMGRLAQGWIHGPVRDDSAKTHPSLVPYGDLPESEKEFDRRTAMETLKAITALGFRIVPPEPAHPKETPRNPWHPAGPGEGSPLWAHLEGKHPKRILALDGGGIKGLVTLGFLEKLERRLGERLAGSGKLRSPEDFALCQYFDLIGGTSTGAIIAAALASGKRVATIKERYLALGEAVFRKDWLQGVRFLTEAQRFRPRVLERHLRDFFGPDLRLGSADLRTGLCVVAKRADTRSTWPLLNHPRGKYYEQNRRLVLWRLLRASTAAPTYFKPQILPTGDVGADGKMVKGAFVDGAVSMANNPALQCFLTAVLDGFPFRWDTGPENLLVVSVGTGSAHYKQDKSEVMKWKVTDLAKEIPSLLMEDAQWQNQLLLQALSSSPTNFFIDGEVGDCGHDLIAGRELFHYLRFDSLLQDDTLSALAREKGDRWPELRRLPEARRLRDISAAQHAAHYAAIGEAEADRMIPDDPEGFSRLLPERFDHVIA
jgi:patatin-like phospholipase/acyl hydrolase